MISCTLYYTGAMSTRVYILGAGFSKPAGFPLAAELTDAVIASYLEAAGDDEEFRSFVEHVKNVHGWLHRRNCRALGIEEFFLIAEQHIKFVRARHHMESVGRYDGETAYTASEDVETWLGYLEDHLLDVLVERDERADLKPIHRLVESLRAEDEVISFNYDILFERACDDRGLPYWLGFEAQPKPQQPYVTLYKLHGSMDWVRPPRQQGQVGHNLELLYRKKDANRERKKNTDPTGDAEYDHELVRIRDRHKMLQIIKDRDTTKNYWSGWAGLGDRKDVFLIPGLGELWHTARESLYNVEEIVIVGFSMSDQDLMARYTFGAFMKYRHDGEGPAPRVIVVAPDASETVDRFQSVFGDAVKPIDKGHEEFDWSELNK